MRNVLQAAALAALAILLVVAGSAVGTQAQSGADELYVVTTNPTALHGFHFDSGTQAFVEDDLAPSSANLSLRAGVDSTALAVTDRFFLIGDNVTDVALSIVDAATGTELPRPSTKAAGGQALTASQDGQFSFESSLGPGAVVPPVVSVVDLRPDSPTLGQEVAAVPLPTRAGTINANSEVSAIDGSGRLFVAISESDSTGARQTRLHTLDVSNPLAPAVLASLDTASPSPPVTSLHAVMMGGVEYLLVARDALEVYQVNSDGHLTLVQSIATSNAAYGPRAVRDAVYVSRPDGDRLIEVTDVPSNNGLASLGEELVVLDMRPGTSTPFNGTVLAVTTLPTVPTNDLDAVALSSDGASVFVLDQGADPSVDGGPQPGHLLAYRTADVLLGSAVPLSARVVDATPGSLAIAGAMVVRAPVRPSSAVTIDSVAVDGSAGAVLVNDQPRTLTVHGSGLADVQHLFVGPVDAAVTAASDTDLTVSIPALAEPAATASVLAIGRGGSASATVTVANSPTYLPGHVVYATDYGGNDIAVINAATKTEVASRLPTGQGPAFPSVSPDGKLLFVPDFKSNDLTVHSLVDDPANGIVAGQRIATIPVGLFPATTAVDAKRLRLYVTVQPLTIVSIGIDPNDPATYLKVIDTIGPLGAGVYRSTALTPDGHYLYAASNHEPFLTIVNVSTDQPAPSDITQVTLGLNEPGGRTDGLAISPDGTRLYFMTLHDVALRLFDITNPIEPLPLPPVTFPNVPPTPTSPGCGPPSADVRTIQAGPDGRFVYVASRSRGCVDIFDPTSQAFVASVPTGTFASTPMVSQDSQFVFVPVEQDDSVKTIDERATVDGVANVNLHRIIASVRSGQGTVSLAISPGLVTPAGSAVAVQPSAGVSLTFDQVTAGGNTTVTSGNTSLLTLPPHFAIAGVPVFFDVKTSASFTGDVTVCFPYDDTGLSPADEANLRLLHEDQGSLVDVTTALDTAANQICGRVSHFSQFVVAQAVNHPPIANAGPDRTVAVGPACTARVRLDGSASSDPDGDPLTFAWSGAFGTASGARPIVTVPLGKETIALSVSDALGATASAATTVVAKDKTPPEMRHVSESISRHGHDGRDGFAPVTFTVSMKDNCNPQASCRITAIDDVDRGWNEDRDRRDDRGRHDDWRPDRRRDHEPSWTLLGPLTVLFRTDANNLHGGIYRVTIECVDAAGNTSSRTVTVTVPHDGPSHRGW